MQALLFERVRRTYVGALAVMAVLTALTVLGVAGTLSATAQAEEHRLAQVGVAPAALSVTSPSFVPMKLGIGEGGSIRSIASSRNGAAPASVDVQVVDEALYAAYDAGAQGVSDANAYQTAAYEPAATYQQASSWEAEQSSPEPVVSATPAVEQPAAELAAVSADAPAQPADDRAAFVDEWGSRIDSYLAGSELAGYGSTFASAAYDYGVDPRWSPAISTIESSQGTYCFQSHNAWGWGSSSWDSWEEAIYDHVEGLATGYGYTVDYESAQTYCPPNADEWYEACVSEMDSI